MGRRQVLRGALAALAVPATACGRSEAPPSPSGGRAVVVGAGLAGLVAAVDLHRAGWDVAVLEATDLVGGRIRTVRGAPLPEGAVMDLGGGRVRPGDAAVLALAEALGVAVAADPRPRVGEVPAACLGGLPTTLEELLADPAVLADVDGVDARLSALREDATAAAGPTDRTLAEALDELVVTTAGRGLVEAALRAATGADPSQLSVHHAAQAWVRPGEDAGMRLEGGAASLVEALVGLLPQPVQRRTEVRAITAAGTDGSRLTVRTTDGDHGADAVVLAVPAPAVRAMELPDPALRAAVDVVGEGAITRVLMVHDAPAWTDAGLDGTLLGDGPVSAIRPTPSPEGDVAPAGLLTVDGAAAHAAALAALAEQAGGVKGVVDACMPGPPLPGGRPAVTARWEGLPVMAPGWLGSATARATPFGRIVLAGDHTAVVGVGRMEAAVASAHRAATQVIAG